MRLLLAFVLACGAACAGESPQQQSQDAHSANLLMQRPEYRHLAKALVEHLEKQKSPQAAQVRHQYQATMPPHERQAQAQRNAPRGRGPRVNVFGVDAGGLIDAAASDDGTYSRKDREMYVREARAVAARLIQEQQYRAEQERLAQAAAEQERQRRAAEEQRRHEQERHARLQREAQERQRQEAEALATRQRQERDRIERERQAQLQAEQKERERQARLAEAAAEQVRQDIEYVETALRHLPDYEPHAAILIHYLIANGVPQGTELLNRHQALRQGANIDRFKRYREQDVQRARQGLAAIVKDEEEAFMREMAEAEARRRAPQPAPQPTPQPRPDARPAVPRERPAASAPAGASPLTANTLAREYEDNEVAADDKYRGKILHVIGVVDSVGKTEFTESPYVKLDSGIFLRDITCSFGKDDMPKLASLKKGQEVIITGRCDGKSFGAVVLSKCEVQAR